MWYYGPPSLDDPDLIDEIEHDRLKRELSHLSINGYSKPIATPHTGQLILKCPFGVFKSPKKPTEYFLGFLPWPLKRSQIEKEVQVSENKILQLAV